MRDHFVKRLETLASEDSSIMLTTADMGFGVFDAYRKLYPSQFINVGIAEQNMTSMAAGMALEGLKVFTYSISNFPTLRCLEQIRNDICYHGANVNIVAIGGGFSYGSLGMSHHATEDLAILRSLPEMVVVSPTSLWEASEATEAITNTNGPCYLRLDKSHGNDFRKEDEEFQLGRVRILKEGIDCYILVTGGILEEVETAVKSLALKGIDAGIISVHTIKPFDKKTIVDIARITPAIITVEEHSVNGGLGGITAETLCDAGVYPKKMLRIGLEDTYSCIVGDQKYLRKRYEMDSESICHRIEKILKG